MRTLAIENRNRDFQSRLFSFAASAALAIGATLSLPATSHADEDGISFWLPGIYGSLAAVPQQPGFTFTAINYYELGECKRFRRRRAPNYHWEV